MSVGAQPLLKLQKPSSLKKKETRKDSKTTRRKNVLRDRQTKTVEHIQILLRFDL